MLFKVEYVEELLIKSSNNKEISLINRRCEGKKR